MTYQKIINKSIIKYSLMALIFTFLLIFLAIIIARFLLQNNIVKTITKNNLVIETTHTKFTAIKSLSDYEGLNTPQAKIMLTNNGEETNYKIKICSKENTDGIRIAINDQIIKDLNSFPQENNCYKLIENYLPATTYHYYEIKVWQKPGINQKAKLNIEVE